MVDIAKAVSYNCDIIALDEPTSSLNEKEVDILMEIIDGLRRQGKGIIYISHKMEEIFRIADDITVMRDGALIKTMRAAETNVDEVIRLMVGRELTDRFPPKQGTIGKEILVVKDLNDLGHHIHDISFDLHEGEVLGIAGLLGANRMLGDVLNTQELLTLATAIEGHPATWPRPLLGGLSQQRL